MSQYIVAIIIVALPAIGLPLYWWWRKRQAAKEELTWPTTWVHTGRPPPPGIEKALEVIQRATPGMPQAGTIEWIDGPFPLDATHPGFLVAGTVVSYRPIRIQLMYFDKPEKTALAHELGHVWSALTDQGFGESYGIDHVTGKPNPNTDTKFVAWFTELNMQIAVALGH
jgi:hypothetical protein